MSKTTSKSQIKGSPGLEPLLLRYPPCKPATKLQWLPQRGDLQDLRSRFGFQVPMSVEYLPPKPQACRPVSVRTRSVVQYLQDLCQKQTEFQRSVFTDPQEKMMEQAADRNSSWSIYTAKQRRMQNEAKKKAEPLVTKEDWVEFHGLFPACCQDAKRASKDRLYGLKKKKPPSQYKASMKLAEAWSRRLNRLNDESQRFGQHDQHCAQVRMCKIQMTQEHQNRCFDMLNSYEERTDPRRLTIKFEQMRKSIARQPRPRCPRTLKSVDIPVVYRHSEAEEPVLLVFEDDQVNNEHQPSSSPGHNGESHRDDEILQWQDRDDKHI
ncbi:uncharacterized protein LOC112565313 isoform X2 [Pomacea canaliculata]|uniref:uncharacterized protein LOC112565313 isoform X2 n=1 Tax=Pomacea canaliculata TaxID=400727 RepID=UPI000D73FCE8|nr:uncharacterized protein LOC112565313 isoform X2 [Pomacea canaliculata]